MTGIYLTGEAAYYVRRIAFVLWLLMGTGMLFSGKLDIAFWGIAFIAMGAFGIKQFGLHRYPPNVASDATNPSPQSSPLPRYSPAAFSTQGTTDRPMGASSSRYRSDDNRNIVYATAQEKQTSLESVGSECKAEQTKMREWQECIPANEFASMLFMSTIKPPDKQGWCYKNEHWHTERLILRMFAVDLALFLEIAKEGKNRAGHESARVAYMSEIAKFADSTQYGGTLMITIQSRFIDYSLAAKTPYIFSFEFMLAHQFISFIEGETKCRNAMDVSLVASEFRVFFETLCEILGKVKIK